MTMDTIGIYEYNSKDLIGHGAFAVVYKGRVKMVRNFLFNEIPKWMITKNPALSQQVEKLKERGQ